MSAPEPTRTTSDRIACPHCGELHTDIGEHGLGDYGTTEIECDCGRSFRLTLHISYDYTATPIEDA